MNHVSQMHKVAQVQQRNASLPREIEFVISSAGRARKEARQLGAGLFGNLDRFRFRDGFEA